MHGCRYIQAASSPKDVIILMDISGSMTGQRNEIAKATVLKILDTLSDEDYFNVIRVCFFFIYLYIFGTSATTNGSFGINCDRSVVFSSATCLITWTIASIILWCQPMPTIRGLVSASFYLWSWKRKSGLRDEHFFLYLGWLNNLFAESARNFAQQNVVTARGHCQL